MRKGLIVAATILVACTTAASARASGSDEKLYWLKTSPTDITGVRFLTTQ